MSIIVITEFQEIVNKIFIDNSGCVTVEIDKDIAELLVEFLNKEINKNEI